MAAITSPNTITVSLARPDGSYTVSALLSTPRNQPIQDFSVVDVNGDGDPDIVAATPNGSSWQYHTWLGEGDGTFGSPTTDRWKPSKKGWF